MIETVKYVECPECRGKGELLEARMYPTGHTEVWVICELCESEGQIEESDYLVMKLAGEV